jgi:hypothetical protein
MKFDELSDDPEDTEYSVEERSHVDPWRRPDLYHAAPAVQADS